MLQVTSHAEISRIAHRQSRERSQYRECLNAIETLIHRQLRITSEAIAGRTRMKTCAVQQLRLKHVQMNRIIHRYNRIFFPKICYIPSGDKKSKGLPTRYRIAAISLRKQGYIVSARALAQYLHKSPDCVRVYLYRHPEVRRKLRMKKYHPRGALAFTLQVFH